MLKILNIIQIIIIIAVIRVRVINTVSQLDLPPISQNDRHRIGDALPTSSFNGGGRNGKILLNNYPQNPTSSLVDDDDRVRGVSSDYDRDRSERFGPPYNLDSIQRSNGPSNGYHGGNGDSVNGGLGNSGGINNNFNSHNYQNPNYNDQRINQGSPFNSDHRTTNQGYQNYPNRDNSDYDRNRYGGGGGSGGGDDRYNDRRNNNYNNNNNNNNNPNYPNDDRYAFEQDRRNQLETERVKHLVNEIDAQSTVECSLNVQAQWDFETNVNEITQHNAHAAQQRYSDYQRVVWDQLSKIDKNQIFDPQLYRQLQLMSNIGASSLPPDQLDRYNRLINDMLAIYNKATICRFEQPFNCGLRLQPHLKDIMANSRDWEELQYTWTEFHRKSGRDMKDLYEQTVELTNESAKQNNFSSAADYWAFPFDSINFRKDVENIWQEILPLYELIHAYVRRKLREFYGPDRINRNAPLPEHVLGNMYGQSWSNILDITIPYPGRHFLEVTPAMLSQGYTPHIMFQLAEEFFLSLNMTILPTDFWIDSILQRPLDRSILCQPSSWDFCNGHDYRIKMCTEVNHKDLITIHHEMTHIQYFISYRNKPKAFRDGANPAFHEALGNAIALSVATPKHLQTLGLIQKSVDDTPHDINFLFALALDKVVFLPFALSLDMWRWDIFDKKISKDQYNCHWWLLRERFSGIKPPVLRSELDFDPGAKYHIPANIPYIRYFFSTVLQFQIHRALCRESHQYNPSDSSKPLHKCDIYRHPEAGHLLKKIMEKGSSQPWQDVLHDVIGEGRLDGMALRDYFRPLEEWLRNENLRNNEFVGWIYDGDYCKHSIDTANLQVYGGFYNNAIRHTTFLHYFSIILSIIISFIFLS